MSDNTDLKATGYRSKSDINTNNSKSCIRRNQINDFKNKSIFDKVDKDHNGILIGDEIKEFNKETQQLKQDNNQKVLAQHAYDNGKKIQAKFKDKNGKDIKGGSYVVVSKPDKFGRKYVVDKNGHTYAMSNDGYILKAAYVNHTNFVDKVKTDKNTAQKATIATLTQQLNKAQKDFKTQLDDDGWAGDVADGVSVLWGSKNRASKVREDLQTYRNQLKILNKSAKNGETQFETTFKKMYGINYNQCYVADYINNPTEANYNRAFGNKNNIASRVAKYNQSQKTGASVVKGATAAAVTIGVGVATGGTSLVAEAAIMATASATAGFSDRLTSHNGLKEGETTQILEDAALDGAMVFGGGQIAKFAGKAVTGLSKTAIAERAAINAAGNATMGAGVEYAQTGHVTLEGTAINAAMGTVGSLSEIHAFRKANKVAKIENSKPEVKTTENFLSTSKAYTPETQTIKQESNSTLLKKTYSAPKTETVEFGMKDDIAASLSENTGHIGNTKNSSTAKSLGVEQEINGQYYDGKLQIVEKDYGCFVNLDNHSKIYKINQGESKIIGTDSNGNNIVIKHKNNGKYTVSHETADKSVHPSSQQSAKIESPKNQPTQTSISESSSKELPIKETITLDNNIQARRFSEDKVNFVFEGGKYKQLEVPRGTSKTFTSSDGKTIMVEHANNGNFTVKIKNGSQPEISPTSSQVIQNKTVTQYTKQNIPEIKDFKSNYQSKPTEIEQLNQLHSTNPQAYKNLAKTEINKLKGSFFNKKSPQYKLLEKYGIIEKIKAGNYDISEQTLHAVKLVNEGKTLVTDLPVDINLSKISDYIENGGVGAKNGKLYINKDGQAVELNISKEKFEELFPPVETSVIQQGSTNSCWFLSSLSAQMDSPKGRAKLYQCFEQKGNDIYVKLPGTKTTVKFDNGIVPEAKYVQADASKGITMLQYAAAINRKGKGSITLGKEMISINDISLTPEDIISRLNLGTTQEAYSLLGYKVSPGELKNAKGYNDIFAQQRGEIRNKENIIKTIQENANNSDRSITLTYEGHQRKIVGYKDNSVYIVDQLYGSTGVAEKIDINELFNYHREPFIVLTKFD